MYYFSNAFAISFLSCVCLVAGSDYLFVCSFRVFHYVPCFATHAVRLSHAVFASASFTSPRRSECVCRHSCRRFPRLYSSFLVSGSFLFRSVLCLRLLETSSPFVISKPRNFIHISLYIFSLHYFCLSSF